MKKTKDQQAYILGQIYRVISDEVRPRGATQADINTGSMRPMWALGHMMGLMFKLRKMTPKIEKVIEKLIEEVTLEDWEDDKVIPLELQNMWIMGYMQGVKGLTRPNWIKKIRTERGLTQKELAELVGVDLRTIGRWEDGDTKPTSDGLKKMAEILDCLVDDLI